MGDGLSIGLFLIGGAMMLFSIMGGGTGAATSITLLVIAGIIALVRNTNPANRKTEEDIMENYRKMYPGWTDEKIYAYRRQQRRATQERMNAEDRNRR